jgi:uncharacterized linocin/CFP29 family protein
MTATQSHLARDRAPISDSSWQEIHSEAKRTLEHFLTGRRLVDFSGPHGWEKDSVPHGRAQDISEEASDGVRARLRSLQPLVEYRADFTLARAELEVIDRGEGDADLEPVRDAARRLALHEDAAIFHGHKAAMIDGIVPSSPNPRLQIDDDYNQYPSTVARAVSILKGAGVGGPYSVALGPRCYTGVVETTELGGYPVLEHLRLITGGQVLWAPAVDGAVVMSTRGGDFMLTVGQDASIGYVDHDADGVRLYLETSFTFQAWSPEAAVHLNYS